MDFTIDFPSLYTTVRRSLSIIGKRSSDEKGNPLFADITLGSREQSLVYDFFTTAIIDLCTELSKFMTAEIRNLSQFSETIYTTFWTNQTPSSIVSQITASGQYLYNPDSNALYISSLSYPFENVTPDTGTLFLNDGTFYSWNSGLTQLTEEQAAALTPEQIASAITIKYFNVNPTSVTANKADIYLYYNSVLYVSQRNASFNSETMPSGAAIVDPQGHAYIRQSNTLVNIPTGTQETVIISIEVPGNWNNALANPLTQALKNYCVAYALYSWFVITAPRISEKYLLDAKNMIAAVVRLAHEKKAPEETTAFIPSATVTTIS